MHRKNNYLSSKALAQTGSLKRNWGLLRPITSYLHLQELGIMERRHHLVTASLQEKKSQNFLQQNLLTLNAHRRANLHMTQESKFTILYITIFLYTLFLHIFFC